MAKDVIITPANGIIDFRDASGISDATIQLDDFGNLNITNANGVLSIGNTAANLYIGDGTNSVDIIFEQDGKIRALTNKTLTLGQSNSFVSVASPFTFISPNGANTITARMLNTDVLSFQGGSGELLSISDTLSGTLFSVNDVSGIPSIEVLANGLVKMAQYGGNVEIGSTNSNTSLIINSTVAATSNTTGALQVDGGMGVVGNVYTGRIVITGPTSNGITFADGTTQTTAASGSGAPPSFYIIQQRTFGGF